MIQKRFVFVSTIIYNEYWKSKQCLENTFPVGHFLVVKTIKQTKKRNLHVAWSLLRYRRVILEKFGKLNFL